MARYNANRRVYGPELQALQEEIKSELVKIPVKVDRTKEVTVI